MIPGFICRIERKQQWKNVKVHYNHKTALRIRCISECCFIGSVKNVGSVKNAGMADHLITCSLWDIPTYFLEPLYFNYRCTSLPAPISDQLSAGPCLTKLRYFGIYQPGIGNTGNTFVHMSLSTTWLAWSNDLWNFMHFFLILAGISTTQPKETLHLWKMIHINSIYSTYRHTTGSSPKCGVNCSSCIIF